MAVQSQVAVELVIAPEITFGTAVAAGSASADKTRRVSSGLTISKDIITSNEVRSDQQVNDERHGTRRGAGPISGELSTITWDDLLEGSMRNTWVAGVTAAPAQFATGLTGTSATVFTFAGAGSLITQGFKVGDIVTPTGLTGAGIPNNNKRFRITGLTGTVMTVDGPVTTFPQQAAAWSMAVAGRKLLLGTAKKSFTIEQSYVDVDISELFTGCRVGGLNLNAQPNGIVTVGFDMMTRDGQPLSGANAPYFTLPNVETTTSLLSAMDGAIRVGGVDQAVLTGLQLNVALNLSQPPVIGSNLTPEIFYGRSMVSGQLTALFDDVAMLNAFNNETEIDIQALFRAVGTDPVDFINLNMQRAKLNGHVKQIGTSDGVIAQIPFKALLKAGGTGTIYDQTTLCIQRSNA